MPWTLQSQSVPAEFTEVVFILLSEARSCIPVQLLLTAPLCRQAQDKSVVVFEEGRLQKWLPVDLFVLYFKGTLGIQCYVWGKQSWSAVAEVLCLSLLVFVSNHSTVCALAAAQAASRHSFHLASLQKDNTSFQNHIKTTEVLLPSSSNFEIQSKLHSWQLALSIWHHRVLPKRHFYCKRFTV